jgi:hypothetical protein
MENNRAAESASLTESRFGKDISKKIEVLAPGEPFMVAKLIPRCAMCGSPNPQALSICPVCSESASSPTLYFERAVSTQRKSFFKRLFGSRE